MNAHQAVPSAEMVASELDPSWLPSTVAQSTAALVAIVGGFLVSRFVGIDAEQRAAARRLLEAEHRSTAAHQAADAARVEDVRARAIDYLTQEDQIERFAGEGVAPSPAEMLEGSGEALSPDQLAPYLHEAVATAVEQRQRLSPLVKPAEYPEWSVARKSLGLPKDEWDAVRAWVWDDVTAKLRDDYREAKQRAERDADPYGIRRLAEFANIVPTALAPSVFEGMESRSKWERLKDQMDAANAAVAQAEAELAIAKRAKAELVNPPGLKPAMLLLTVVALVGLVLPVILLAREPLGGEEADHITVLVGFLVGIALLLGYLWLYAVRLGRRHGS